MRRPMRSIVSPPPLEVTLHGPAWCETGFSRPVVYHKASAVPGFSLPIRYATMDGVTAIRVIFDGKTFVPQEPVSLPVQAEALVFVDQTDPRAAEALDAAIRAYYQGIQGGDADDDAWGKAVSPMSHRAWDED